MCNIYSCFKSSCKDYQGYYVSSPEENLIYPTIVYRNDVVFVWENQTEHHTETCLHQEEHKVNRHETEYREFFLHELAKESELEKEGFPDEEEKPENEAKVHGYLKTHGGKGYKLVCTHTGRVSCSLLQEVVLVIPNVVEESHGVADDLYDDEHKEGDDL